MCATAAIKGEINFICKLSFNKSVFRFCHANLKIIRPIVSKFTTLNWRAEIYLKILEMTSSSKFFNCQLSSCILDFRVIFSQEYIY